MDHVTVGLAMVLLGLGAYVVACKGGGEATASTASPNGSSLPDRDPALAKRLVEEEGALLLDVRTNMEWKSDHLDGATLIPVQELPSRLDEVEKATGGKKDQPIVLYCRSGARASKAKQILLKAGYTKVTNVGGISDYPR